MPSSQIQYRRGTLFLFALPAILQGLMHAPAKALIEGIYAKHTALALTAIGAAVLITRLFDAVTDPLIGLASDAWHRRTGSRKAFVLAGTLISATGLWFLYRPPEDVGIVYFTGWFMVAYLGWTITEIPYRAWSFELSSEHVMRTRIQTWLAVAMFAGTFAFYSVPYLTRALGLTTSLQINMDTLRYCALGIVALMPLSNLIAVLCVPDGQTHREPRRLGGQELWLALRHNGPFLYFIAMSVILLLTSGLAMGITYIYIDGYLGLSEQLAGILLLSAPATLLGLPAWGLLCQRYERKKVWAVALALGGLSYLAYGLVPAGGTSAGLVALLYGLTIFFLSSTHVVAFAMLGDVADYGLWKFGHDLSGTYTAFYTMISKSILGMGAGMALMMLGWFGYDPGAAAQSDGAAYAIRAMAAWLPGLGVMLIAPLVWRFPIDRSLHARLLDDIEQGEAPGQAQAA